MELLCNGTFEDKDPHEVMKYMDLLYGNARIGTLWALIRHRVKLNLIHLVDECTNLMEDHDLQAKFASLARKVEALELKMSGQLKYVQKIVCQIYETNEHSTNDCLTLPSFNECLHEQANALNNFQRLN